MEKLAKGVPEAYPDEEEIARVSEFAATVAEIESLRLWISEPRSGTATSALVLPRRLPSRT